MWVQPWKARTLGVALLTTLAVLAVPHAGGQAKADVPLPGDFAPMIWSDRADYAPGDHVVLSGANWQPGESVHIVVNDDAGSTWNHSIDVIADAVGNITDEFDLPSWFVAQYSITATGSSGAVARGGFSDGNVKVSIDGGAVSPLTETLYTAATNCTGAVKSGFPKTFNASTSDSQGVGGSESIRIDVPANPDSPNAAKVFRGWSSTDTTPSPFSVIPGTSGRSICVAGFSSGSRNYVARYSTNNAPVAAG